MSEQQHLRLVQEFYAAFKRGDITGSVLNTLADDVGWFIPGPKDIIPFVGRRQGREQVPHSPRRQGSRSGTLPMARKVHRALICERLGTRIHNSRWQSLELSRVFGHPRMGSGISQRSILCRPINKPMTAWCKIDC
jgi:hypothetical protein